MIRPGANFILGLGFGLALLAGAKACLLPAEAAPARSRSVEAQLTPEELSAFEGPGPIEVEPGPRNGTVKLSFPPVVGALGYEVERSGWDEGPWEDAATGTAAVLVVGGLKPRTSYCFRVAAKRRNGTRSPFGVPGCGRSR